MVKYLDRNAINWSAVVLDHSLFLDLMIAVASPCSSDISRTQHMKLAIFARSDNLAGDVEAETIG